MKNVNMFLRKVYNCVVIGFTVLQAYIVIAKIMLTTSRIFSHCGLLLERNPRDKRGTTV